MDGWVDCVRARVLGSRYEEKKVLELIFGSVAQSSIEYVFSGRGEGGCFWFCRVKCEIQSLLKYMNFTLEQLEL